MTKEERNLLVKDLCGRLPYKVKCQFKMPNYKTQVFDDKIGEVFSIDIQKGLVDMHCEGIDYNVNIENVKPYLRQLSSMTKEEQEEIENMWGWHYDKEANAIYNEDVNNPDDYGGYHIFSVCEEDAEQLIDWLNEHHFDYRGLIDKGLVIELK